MNATHFFDFDILQINAGMIAEQFVGQELLACEVPYQNIPLLFWERSGGQAEVDYVVSVGSDIVPVEVKAGATGSLRSIQEFIREKKGRLGVRISEHPLSLHKQVLSIPLYMIGSLEYLVSNVPPISA